MLCIWFAPGFSVGVTSKWCHQQKKEPDNRVGKVEILKDLTPRNLLVCNDHLKAKACKKYGIRGWGGGAASLIVELPELDFIKTLCDTSFWARAPLLSKIPDVTIGTHMTLKRFGTGISRSPRPGVPSCGAWCSPAMTKCGSTIVPPGAPLADFAGACSVDLLAHVFCIRL